MLFSKEINKYEYSCHQMLMIKNNRSNGSWPNANTIRVCIASMIMIIYISVCTNAPPFLMDSILVFMNS